MLRRIHEQRRALGYYAADIGIPILTSMQWELIDSIIYLLQPFEELTKQKSCEMKYIYLFIPSVIIF